MSINKLLVLLFVLGTIQFQTKGIFGERIEKRSYFEGAVAVEIDTHGPLCTSVVTVRVHQPGKWKLRFASIDDMSEPKVPDIVIDAKMAPREIVAIRDIPYFAPHVTVTDVDHGGRVEDHYFYR